MGDRYFRNNGYASDGFFLIKTELENAHMRKRKADTDRQPNLQEYVDKNTNGMFIELVNPQDFTIETYDTKALKFTSKDNAFNVVINKKLLRYFGSFKGLSFETKGELYPVIVRRKGEFTGFVMPIRIN